MRGTLGKVFAVFIALLIVSGGLIAHLIWLGPVDMSPGENPGGSVVEPAKSLSVSYAGEELENGANLIIDGLTEEHEFNVSSSSFRVNITPNEYAGFIFYKDEEECSFLAVTGLNDVFDVSTSGNKITINLGNGFSMQKLLEKLYPNSAIELPEDFNDAKNYFNVEILTEKESFVFTLGINNSGVTGVILDITHIDFGK